MISGCLIRLRLSDNDVTTRVLADAALLVAALTAGGAFLTGSASGILTYRCKTG